MSGLNVHEQHLEAANRVVSALVEREQPIANLFGLYLIGSVARNRDNESSDVDIIFTHQGPEESFPFVFLNAVWESLEQAPLPLRPSRTRRSDKFPGTIHPLIRSEDLFQNSNLIPVEDFRNEQIWMKAIIAWTSIHDEAVKLYHNR